MKKMNLINSEEAGKVTGGGSIPCLSRYMVPVCESYDVYPFCGKKDILEPCTTKDVIICKAVFHIDPCMPSRVAIIPPECTTKFYLPM